MAIAKQSSSQAVSAREFKHRVLTCLNKLSDRDTYSAAATELESIAKNTIPLIPLPSPSNFSLISLSVLP
ncbi:hypothetical protein LguiA_035763 [Lonicera macranthoides]